MLVCNCFEVWTAWWALPLLLAGGWKGLTGGAVESGRYWMHLRMLWVVANPKESSFVFYESLVHLQRILGKKIEKAGFHNRCPVSIFAPQMRTRKDGRDDRGMQGDHET
jgi:hypothetical protein